MVGPPQVTTLPLHKPLPSLSLLPKIISARTLFSFFRSQLKYPIFTEPIWEVCACVCTCVMRTSVYMHTWVFMCVVYA